MPFLGVSLLMAADAVLSACFFRIPGYPLLGAVLWGVSVLVAVIVLRLTWRLRRYESYSEMLLLLFAPWLWVAGFKLCQFIVADFPSRLPYSGLVGVAATFSIPWALFWNLRHLRRAGISYRQPPEPVQHSDNIKPAKRFIKREFAVSVATLGLLTVNTGVMAWFIHSGYGMTWSIWSLLTVVSVVTLLLHFSKPDSELLSMAMRCGFSCWLVAPGLYLIFAVTGDHTLTNSPDFLMFSLSVSIVITFFFTVIAALNPSHFT
jgi:hypothetical protein